MKRRPFLGVLAGSASLCGGCLSATGESNQTSDGPLTISNYDVPGGLDVDVTPSVVAQPSESSPGTIELELENTSATRRAVDFGVPMPFGNVSSEGSGSKVLLIDIEEDGLSPPDGDAYIPDQRQHSCWVSDRAVISSPAVGNSKQHLAGGESVANHYILLATEPDDCPLDGAFHFTFDIPLESDIRRETNDEGYVTNVTYPTWDLEVTVDRTS